MALPAFAAPRGIDPSLFWLSIAAEAAVIAWIIGIWIRAARKSPKVQTTDIVYQEWTASGCSDRNFLTRLGGGRNCVRLLITKEFLWVTSWFPFTPFAAIWDMVHFIPRRSISSLVLRRWMLRDVVQLTYMDDNGQSRALLLAPKNRGKFLAALGIEPRQG